MHCAGLRHLLSTFTYSVCVCVSYRAVFLSDRLNDYNVIMYMSCRQQSDLFIIRPVHNNAGRVNLLWPDLVLVCVLDHDIWLYSTGCHHRRLRYWGLLCCLRPLTHPAIWTEQHGFNVPPFLTILVVNLFQEDIVRHNTDRNFVSVIYAELLIQRTEV